MGIKVRRNRCADWSDEETMVLVQLKRKAYLNNEEGNLVWIQISGEISKTFVQAKSAKQCRMRWDTLKKVYNAIEKHCIENGQEHWQLDKELLESMKLPTAYLEDWYTVVKEVYNYSERHRKRNVRKGSRKRPSRIIPVPAISEVLLAPYMTINTPEIDTLLVTTPAPNNDHAVIATFTYQEKSTSIDDVQSSTRPNVDVENPIDHPEDDSKRLLIEEIEALKSKLQVVEQQQQQQSAQFDQLVRLFCTHNSAGLIHTVEQNVDSESATRTDSLLFTEPDCTAGLLELNPPPYDSSDIDSCTISPQFNSASSSDQAEIVLGSEFPRSWEPASPGQCSGAEIATGSQEMDSCMDTCISPISFSELTCTDSNRFLESECPEVCWFDIDEYFKEWEVLVAQESPQKSEHCSSRWRKWKGVFKFAIKLLVTISLEPALKRRRHEDGFEETKKRHT